MSGSEIPRELRAALRRIAAGDAPGMIEQAHSAALTRARKLIEDALVEELVQEASRSQNLDLRPQSNDRPDGHSEDRPDGQAWWAYGVLSADDAVAIAPRLEGIEPGTDVEVVTEGRIAALVSSVPLAEYGDERLREHLEDIRWVERTARAHEAVLDRALGTATLVPLRLCTLYRHHGGVRRFLAENREVLVDALRRIEGCTEWGVKLFADPRAGRAGALEDPAEGASAASAEGERSGAAYLAERQRERTLAEMAGELRARCAETVHGCVSELASAATVNPPQRRELHGRDLTMVLNGAYLVERARAEDLRALVERLRTEWEPHGFVLELTGPWPAYNFVSGAAGVVT